MRRAIGLLGVCLALIVAGYVYQQKANKSKQEMESKVSTMQKGIKYAIVPKGGENPRATIDLVGVKIDLNNIAQAERMYFTRENHYASLDELRSSGDLTMQRSTRGPYTYSASVSESGFVITATYSGPLIPEAPSSLSIDETLTIR